ncbi:Hypothetical protein A7982_06290 [Minicystis rosea]|nr:Hypothetical protein A7982_06290 [Minicystis rosea]
MAQCLANANTKCIFNGARPEVRDALVTCLNERDCDTGDDDCYFEVGLTNPVPGQNEYLSACAVKITTCNGSLKDDFCGITLLSSETYEALSQCLQKTCDEAKDCIATVLGGICPGA